MSRVNPGEPGEARPDYDTMSLPELEARERQQREAFRDAFDDLQGRLSDGGEKVGGAARRVKEAAGAVDEVLRRHHRVVVATSIGLGFALGYSRRRVVAERSPAERDEEYVLVRRERRRRSPLRAVAAKLAGLAAAEGLQLATQLAAEMMGDRRGGRTPSPPVYEAPPADDTPADIVDSEVGYPRG
jgi:hypothetical protein